LDEIAAAKLTADEATATADEAKTDSTDAKDAASDAQRHATSARDVASDAKNAVDSMKSSIPGLSAIDSEAVKRDIRCIKYEMKKLKANVKLIDVSVSTPGVDALILQERRNEITYAKGAAEDAKATADKTNKESGEAKNAASQAVQATVPVGVWGSEGVDSDSMKKDLRCIKYETKKLKRKVKETVRSIVPEVIAPVECGYCSRLSAIAFCDPSGAFVRCLYGLFVLSAGAVVVTCKSFTGIRRSK
jgi:hypothetical protein